MLRTVAFARGARAFVVAAALLGTYSLTAASTASAAPLAGHTADAAKSAIGGQSLTENVRHRFHKRFRRHHRLSHRLHRRHFRPYYYGSYYPYYSPYYYSGYPYYYHRRPGIYLRFGH